MIYMEEGNGVTITDVDGNEHIDFHCGVSSIINGHNPDQKLSVVRKQLDCEGDEITAVITEATLSNSGLLWPEDSYLNRLRKLTREYDTLFILR